MQMGLYKSDISNSIIDHAIRRRQHGAIRLLNFHISLDTDFHQIT